MIKRILTLAVILAGFIYIAVPLSSLAGKEDEAERLERKQRWEAEKYEEEDEFDDDYYYRPFPTAPAQSEVATAPLPLLTPTEWPPVSATTEVTAPIHVEPLLDAAKDSDSDGIPDIVDRYPGENDAIYGVKDENINGISDALDEFARVALR